MRGSHWMPIAAMCAVVLEAAPGFAAQSTAESPPGGKTYTIDAAQSEVLVLVHHSSRIGHNHVIVNHHLGGAVNFSGDPRSSSFALNIPVNEFEVDDEKISEAEGADFASKFSPSDRAETKGHMLGPKLLDGGHFGEITLKSSAVTPGSDGFVAALAVRVAGHQSTLMVPFTFSNSGGVITATGSAPIRQSELGLKPLSFMMGAITIQDEMTVKFKLVAAAGP